MADDSTGEAVPEMDPEVAGATEAFSLLADETRLRILLVLAESDSMAGFDAAGGLSFGELREAVGVEDPGRFNYHLGKLRGDFVRKTDSGYALRYAGYRVTADIASGVYHQSVSSMQADTDVKCLQSDCENTQIVEYEDSYVRLSCPDPAHETTFQTALPPNAAMDRDAETVLSIATRDSRHMIEHARSGTCPICWGQIETEVPVNIGAGEELIIGATANCTDCTFTLTTPVSVFAASHAAVTMAYDVPDPAFNDRPVLDYPFVRQPEATTLRSEDPIRIAVDTDPDDDVNGPTLVFAGDLSVHAIE